jgi:hypothetical protein
VIKNTEVLYFLRNDQKELIGINKNVSSRINMTMEGNTINTMTFFTDVDGDIYPENELPENARKLKGFIWREDERILDQECIFPDEENTENERLVNSHKAEMAKENVPMKIRKETLNYDKNNPKPNPAVK